MERDILNRGAHIFFLLHVIIIMYYIIYILL